MRPFLDFTIFASFDSKMIKSKNGLSCCSWRFLRSNTFALFVTSKIDFSICAILELKMQQNAFKMKKSQA